MRNSEKSPRNEISSMHTNDLGHSFHQPQQRRSGSESPGNLPSGNIDESKDTLVTFLVIESLRSTQDGISKSKFPIV